MHADHQSSHFTDNATYKAVKRSMGSGIKGCCFMRVSCVLVARMCITVGLVLHKFTVAS